MNDLQNFIDYLEDGDLSIPGIPSKKYPEGKTYIIPSPNAETGARLAALGDMVVRAGIGADQDPRLAEKLKLDDDQENDLMEQVMGDVRAEMIEDGVNWVHLRGVMKYAFIYFALGKESADNALKNGVLAGKAQEPANRQERRQQQRTQQGRQGSGGSSSRQGQRRRR